MRLDGTVSKTHVDFVKRLLTSQIRLPKQWNLQTDSTGSLKNIDKSVSSYQVSSDIKLKNMPRSKNAVASKARRKKILKQAKGFYGKRKNVLDGCQERC